MVFKPHKESGLLGAGEALLVDPVVVGTKIGIHQRAGRIHVGLILVGRQQIVRGLRPRSEAYEQSDGLCTPQHFSRSPLRKGGAEYLRSRTFREQLHLKTLQHRICFFPKSEFRRAHLRKQCAQRLRPHAGLIFFCANLPQQRSPRRFQSLVRNASHS